MGTEGQIPGHPHSRRELCAPGQQLYADALRTGRIPRTEVEQAPCLIDLALVHADPDDPEWLRPLPPTVALGHLVHPIEQEIQERRRIAIGLTETFAPSSPWRPRTGRLQRHHRAGRAGAHQHHPRPGRRGMLRGTAHGAAGQWP